MKCEANGGSGDLCEDVIGAFDQALKLKFESKTTLVYLVCDNPSHGKQYYDMEDCLKSYA
jgi:hypothetical protein